MRLDFNVLWVDDQPQQLDSQIIAIAKGMQDQGFDFRATTCRNLDEVRALVANDVFTDEVDLILVDWGLGADLQGQQVISEIREVIRYQDVVFYSSLTSAAELRGLAAQAGAEGVFCVSKVDIVEEVLGVFEALVKKVLDLDHTRGIVMGATSDIDHMVAECLTSIHHTADESGQEQLFKKAKALISETIKDLEKKAKKLEAATGVAALLEAHALFTASDRLRMLNEVLANEEYNSHDGLRGSLKIYITDVVPKRNQLGHLVLLPAGKPVTLVDGTGKVVTLDEMRNVRRFLLDLRSDFRKLRDALSVRS